jgi:hypothetical protein
MPEEHAHRFVVCDRCGTATIQSLLCLAESDIEYNDGDGCRNIEPATYRMFRCDGCMRISLYVWSNLHSPHTEIGERQYPRSEPRYCLPPSVQAAYIEARNVKRQSASAYGIMVRRALEAVSRDRGINCRNLATSLAELIRREQIPPRLAEAITRMRTLGNAAAHNPGRPVNVLHVEMMERFLDALLEHIYLLPADVDFFKQMEDIDSDEDNF